jgi:glucosamine 6-phosphate synthetase-like amidotransferase/phosphosugar isomerase protein
MPEITSTGDMYNYILESKNAIRNIIENRETILKNAFDYFLSNDIEQIYMIGSGTSYHASLAARRIMEKVLGKKIFVSYPMPFKDNELIFNPKTLVMGSSHGGLSSSTIAGLDKARKLGLKTIASTAVYDSEITKHGDVTLYYEIGEENAGPKTKGYFGAIVTNMLFALEAAERMGGITKNEKEDYIKRIQVSSDNIPLIANKANNWYEKNATELKQARRIIIIGYENNISTFMEGTLKILEAVRYSVTGYELEEFMHGIYHSVFDDCYMFYIAAKGQYFERILRLKKYFEERTEHNFIFTGNRNFDGGKNFTDDFIDDPDFSCLEYIVPLQVIARRLSADLGINCNIPSDPDFHRKMGSYRFQ